MLLEGAVVAVNVEWVCDVFKNRSEASSSPLCCIVDHERKKKQSFIDPVIQNGCHSLCYLNFPGVLANHQLVRVLL